MKAAIKRKWLKALRSGMYQQTTTVLFAPGADGGYCCLGVLRHCVTGKNAGRKPQNEELLSHRFVMEVGLTEDAQESLSEKNDGGWSFLRIARWIEKHL